MAKIIIDTDLLEGILDEMYDLQSLISHLKDYPSTGAGSEYFSLVSKINTVQKILKNAGHFDVTCSKCGMTEGETGGHLERKD